MLKSASLQTDAEALTTAFPPLHIAAAKAAQAVLAGSHGRLRAGMGEDFWQFRRYQAGDPSSAIDWRQSARHDKIYVRETEWQAAQTLWCWCDRSGSMPYASAAHLPSKLSYGRLLIAALALLAMQASDRVVIGGVGERKFHGQQNWLTLVQMLEKQPVIADDPATQDQRLAATLLCSDFLVPLSRLERWLKQTTSHGGRRILIRIHDPAELEFTFAGHIVFEGCEQDGTYEATRADYLAELYRHKLRDHQAVVAQAAERQGWTIIDARTDQPPATILLKLYTLLQQAWDKS